MNDRYLENLVKNLKWIFERLVHEALNFKHSKRKLFAREVDFLRHTSIASAVDTHTDPTMPRSVKGLPVSVSVNETKLF